jgi:hypothetical protein
MKYLVSQIESWREEIAAPPPPDPGRRRVGKEQAVIMMAKELRVAARQGYTSGELLEVLAAKGLEAPGHLSDDSPYAARIAAGPPAARPRSHANGALKTGCCRSPDRRSPVPHLSHLAQMGDLAGTATFHDPAR